MNGKGKGSNFEGQIPILSSMRYSKEAFSSYLLALCLFLIPLSGNAWWDAGHMVTAAIAYKQLDPKVKKKCDQWIKKLNKEYDYTNHFIAAATWPDDLKGEGVHFYDTWHYTNIPFNPDGVEINCLPEVDVIWAISKTLDVLQSSQAREFEKARALAFLIHFVGDIHQPLHSTTMYTQAMSGGDRGGNSFMIQDSHEKLHALWDDGCGYTSELNNINPYGEPKEALSNDHLERIQQFADKVEAAYPGGKQDYSRNTDPRFWAQESHHLAVKYAYHGVNGVSNNEVAYLEPWGKPSQLYLDNGKEVVAKRLSLGGYRLARILNKALKD